MSYNTPSQEESSNTQGKNTLTVTAASEINGALQKLSALGGGILALNTGTYNLMEDIYIPSGVTLEGISRDNVIIDCALDYGVKVVGGNAYSTGTVTLNDGDTAVVGTGTTFTTDMVGQFIILDGSWYEITAWTDATNITIGSAYDGVDLTISPYTIADAIFHSVVKNLTIVNATGAGLTVANGNEIWMDDIMISGCGVGIDMDNVYAPRFFLSSFNNGVNATLDYVTAFEIIFSAFYGATIGAGLVFTNCQSATMIDSDASHNATNGMSLTNCNDIAFISISVSDNTENGVELIAGNTSLSFNAMQLDNNTMDGIKLTATSDNNILSSLNLIDNGGYGINVGSATCDNNIILGNFLSGSVLGQVNDSGTTTLIRSNIGATDSP